ncbi:MAG: hypothetical protein ACXVIJ_11525, partial [Thermoanaerobaculia bacterium]
LFDYISAHSKVAKRGIAATAPPVYGAYRPLFTRWGFVSIALALCAAGAAYLISRRERIRTMPFVVGSCAFLLSFAASIAIIGGDPARFVDPLLRVKRSADYIADVPLVRRLGVRGFMSSYPHLFSSFKSVHSKTHPPGATVFISYLGHMSPHHLIPRALVIAAISSMVLIPTFFLARRVAGPRAAIFAVLLLAVAPAPALFTFLSMDAVYATLLASAAAILAWGLGKDGKPRVAFLGGLVLGLISVMTYAVSFIASFAVLWAVLRRRPWKVTVRLLLFAFVGGIVAIAALWAILDFNLVASYRASLKNIPQVPLRSYPYWIFGNPAVWLTFAGLPIAALSILELTERRPLYLLALFIPLVVADLAKGVFPGETERIGQFAYPFIATAAGASLVRLESWRGRRRPGIVAILVLMTAMQAVVLQWLYFTYW